jgi:hypothetical protein
MTDVEIIEAKRAMNMDMIGQSIAGAIVLTHTYSQHRLITKTVVVGCPSGRMLLLDSDELAELYEDQDPLLRSLLDRPEAVDPDLLSAPADIERSTTADDFLISIDDVEPLAAGEEALERDDDQGEEEGCRYR